MTALEKLPFHVRRVIETARSGQVLCRQICARGAVDTAEALIYWFEPSGRTAPAWSSSRAIAEGYLQPLDAGLLGDGNAQAYGAADV